jgi:L-ascorbate metabolism protein UlaG (beta-lactamase superfamily)
MKIKWLGHSAFLITSGSGTTILTDPYKSGSYEGAVGYDKITDTPDIVVVSHEHDDHNSVDSVPGNPVVLKGVGEHESKGIKFRGVGTYHDKTSGKERGENTVFVFDVDGLKVCHLGDLGHTIDEGLRSEIGNVDVLLVPVGGFFTIDAAEATQVADVLNPSVVIPMHFKTEKLGFPIAGVDPFLEDKEDVKRLGATELELLTVEGEKQVIVLDHAL